MAVKDLEKKYEIVESRTDEILTHLVHLKWTAALIAVVMVIDLWLIL